MKNSLLVIALILFPFIGLAETSLSSLIVQPSRMPAGWYNPYSNYSVSPLATVFFENYGQIYAHQLPGRLVDKQMQSFGGPDKATVFYMVFSGDTPIGEIEQFAKRIIWEGPTPSSAHPERIFTKDSALIIVSSQNSGMADELEKIIRSK